MGATPRLAWFAWLRALLRLRRKQWHPSSPSAVAPVVAFRSRRQRSPRKFSPLAASTALRQTCRSGLARDAVCLRDQRQRLREQARSNNRTEGEHQGQHCFGFAASSGTRRRLPQWHPSSPSAVAPVIAFRRGRQRFPRKLSPLAASTALRQTCRTQIIRQSRVGFAREAGKVPLVADYRVSRPNPRKALFQ
jgi:hypothetical protein